MPAVPQKVAVSRASLLQSLFPQGIPKLWCPPITHYDAKGAIDKPRLARHWRRLSAHVKGVLVPGSTGDGWELNEQERRELLEIAVEQASLLGIHLLIGALKRSAAETIQTIRDDLAWLKARFKRADSFETLVQARVCGFTICAPSGKELSQERIGSGLASVLELGLPTAIYQLPQVTGNELSPELTSELANRFANFILFKDTSGTDRVALSGEPLAGVFTVRGAEADYARWLKEANGSYDGFLLSSANCFARELHEIIENVMAKRVEEGRRLSETVADAITEVFNLVSKEPAGNAFANANKAIDHFFAHGPKAASAAPPRLHAGIVLPAEVIRATGESLWRRQLMPSHGYLFTEIRNDESV